ncbi:AAA family ATPase [Leucobacter weissii]|uniref:AAA family ATPase n=2 Tax=Leucobacter weissii TaxID=1983706 RepID=A0A939MK52_9MICO|nr:AAA family ATPase [Leucobacter weissii]
MLLRQQQSFVEGIEPLLMAASTRAATAVLVGDSGMGKTTVIEAVAERASSLGRAVLLRGDRYESDLGFATLEELFRRLRLRGGESLTTADTDPVAQGHRLLRYFDELREPLFLLFDDIQWIDPSSARALRFVLRRSANHRLVVIGAARPVDHPLLDILSTQISEGMGFFRGELAPMMAEDVQNLAWTSLRRRISFRTASALRNATNGSPFVVMQLLRSIEDSLDAAPHPASWEIALPEIPSIQESVRVRLDALPEAARNTVDTVAILGEAVSLPQLSELARRSGAALSLSESETSEFLAVRRNRGVVWFEPRHLLLAEAIRASAPLDVQLRVHRLGGEILTGHRALKHRAEGSSDYDPRLVSDLIDAANTAADRSHHDAAVSFALSAVELQMPGDEHERTLLKAGVIALRGRQHQRIFHLIPRFMELPQNLMRDMILIEILVLVGDHATSFRLLKGALSDRDPSADARAVRGHIAAALPMAQLATGQFEPIIGQVQTARALLSQVPTDPAELSEPSLAWLISPQQDLLRLQAWLIIALCHLRREDELEEAFEVGDALLEGIEQTPAAVDYLTSKARAMLLIGRPDWIRAELQEVYRFLPSASTAWTGGHSRISYAHVLFIYGNWDEAAAVLDTAVAFALDETDRAVQPLTYAIAALIHAARGDFDDAAGFLQSGADYETGGLSTYEVDIRFIAAAELGRAQADPSAQLRAVTGEALSPRIRSTLGWMTYRIDALAELGRYDEAAELLEAVEASSRWQPYYGSLNWLRGRVAESAGDLDSALEHFLADDAETSPFRFADAVRLLSQARVQQRLDQTEPALASAQRAATIFSSLGAAPYRERALRLLARIPSGPRSAGAPGPGTTRVPEKASLLAATADPLEKLTTRERQIAHFIGRGWTNREIADHLFVSVTTVNFHTRNVFAKLGVKSRRAVREIATSV